ncbi:hypothetical protein HMPREF3033_00588 [Veillonellaceae bacterium DNF00751]|nr:hypothetical protein HMPREF3033_00588 [Veillonellaceae bacterium DNF00751]
MKSTGHFVLFFRFYIGQSEKSAWRTKGACWKMCGSFGII